MFRVGAGDDDGISLNDNSTLRIRNATIQNNSGAAIKLRRGGAVNFRTPTSDITDVDENALTCIGALGGETHYSFSPAATALPPGMSIDINCVNVNP